MSDVAPYQQPTDSWVPVLGAVGDLAAKLAATQFVPRAMQRQPASVAAAILTGREMGLGPMAALRGIDVIEGRPSLTAQMLAARILTAGHRIEWVTATDRACTVRIERGDGLSTAEVTWTIGDAQRAGLATKKVWQQYPRHMLRARALSECAAMACPDVALGLDVLDRADDDRPTPTAGASVVQIRHETTEPPEPLRREALPEGAGKSDTSLPESPDPALPALYTVAAVEAAPPEEPLVTPAQLRKLNAQLGELERIEGRKFTRDERRDLIAALADADGISSAKQLTNEQGSQAIENLDRAIGAAMEAGEEPVGVEHLP